LVNHAIWMSAGGELTGSPHPPVLDHDMTDLLDNLIADTTYDGFTTLDMLDEDA